MWRQKADLTMTEYSKLEGRRTPWLINTKSNSLKRPKDTALTSKWKKEKTKMQTISNAKQIQASIHGKLKYIREYYIKLWSKKTKWGKELCANNFINLC